MLLDKDRYQTDIDGGDGAQAPNANNKTEQGNSLKSPQHPSKTLLHLPKSGR